MFISWFTKVKQNKIKMKESKCCTTGATHLIKNKDSAFTHVSNLFFHQIKNTPRCSNDYMYHIIYSHYVILKWIDYITSDRKQQWQMPVFREGIGKKKKLRLTLDIKQFKNNFQLGHWGLILKITFLFKIAIFQMWYHTYYITYHT